MKAVVQRVSDASVSVDGVKTGQISFGLLVYVGVAADDETGDADWLVDKITNLRIFDDAEGKMNHSLIDIVNNLNNKVIGMLGQDNNSLPPTSLNYTGILAISQFTLLGDARKGRRPSWSNAAPPEKAEMLYDYFINTVRKQGLLCECGIFQARMKVSYTNEGPVTILLDSRESINRLNTCN